MSTRTRHILGWTMVAIPVGGLTAVQLVALKALLTWPQLLLGVLGFTVLAGLLLGGLHLATSAPPNRAAPDYRDDPPST